MSRSVIFVICFAIVGGLMGFAFWLGGKCAREDGVSDAPVYVSQKSEITTARDMALAMEDNLDASFWASLHHVYIRMYRDNKIKDAVSLWETQLWYTIIPLSRDLMRSDLTEDKRKVSRRALEKVVLYFYQNPRQIDPPEEMELSGAMATQLEKYKAEAGEEDLSIELLEGFMGEMESGISGFEATMNDIMVIAYMMDLEIQSELDSLINQHIFPGVERKFADITFHLPKTPGSSSGSSNGSGIRWRGEGFDLNYESNKQLIVNGKSYGRLSAGDNVDLRIVGKVFINDEEAKPKSDEAD